MTARDMNPAGKYCVEAEANIEIKKTSQFVFFN